MSPKRTGIGAALATAVVLLLSGCGNAGGLESAGSTPTAVGPVELWPDLPPISVPPVDYGESDTRRVPGIAVPNGDVHAVSPTAVVQDDVSAQPAKGAREDGLSEATVRRIRDCTAQPQACPILRAHYHDLTGDGKDELIIGITLPDKQTSIRVYMPEDGGLTRIMEDAEPIVSVSLAGRDLIMRSLSAGIPGYEYRTAWSWDERQRAMLPARDEIIRIKPSTSATPEASADTR
ncbi:hypothetical protein [Streptomyces sp. NPDC059176]|uniref:hypothetical protein n=1 Tax=Streptomyces sp. NPDC059176 TaxID=3346758 RepID=UPI0036CBBAFF